LRDGTDAKTIGDNILTLADDGIRDSIVNIKAPIQEEGVW
jgi:hypothetical protein